MENINTLANDTKQLKVFIADIAPKNLRKEILEDRMDELENLVNTFGGFVIEKRIQRRDSPDSKTYIGKGKLEEVIDEMVATNANLLIIGNILKPSQLFKINEKLRELSEKLGLKEPMKAWDRIDMILQIFDKHANNAEAKLQIELAAIKHMGPRIYGMGMELSKQGAGIGTKGIGETNTEIMKRHLKEKQRKIAKKLEEFEKMRLLHRQSRARKGMPIIGIVGYTNTGKSSLLNLLTKKGVLAENKLFATLGTSVGKMFLFTDMEKGQGKEILLSDTIGFIRDLPPQLIKAFASTLEDSIQSDLLFHVVDASDPFIQERIDVVNEILDKIGAKQKRILVFNKIDKINEKMLQKLQNEYDGTDNLRISVREELGIDKLKARIVEEVL